jgi:gas vesicle protein
MVRNTSESLVWFVAGAAVGASLALLYAPQTGRDTRRLISKKTRRGREAVAEMSRDLAGKGRDLFDKGRRVADDAAELFERGRKLVEG